jgi:hypothetical protein
MSLAKSLFPQFTSTLDWLKLELPRHGFQFRTLSGEYVAYTRKGFDVLLSSFLNSLTSVRTLFPSFSVLVPFSMTMKQRAKALNDFQNDPPTVFLLSVRYAAFFPL